MSEKEYTYNGRRWRPQPTVSGGNSFFHAVFGEGRPRLDRDANFRRRCSLNFLTYFQSLTKPQPLKERLEKILNAIESDEDYFTLYKGLTDGLSSSEQAVSLKEIPIISALENTVIVVFTEDKEVPCIFDPEENLLGNYPWKIKADVEEAVICVRDNDYVSLCFDRYETPSLKLSLEESTVEPEGEVEEKEDRVIPTRKCYSKLSGSAGIKGSLYQIDLLTIYLLKASKLNDSFWLSTENKCAGKFDDVVLETPPEGGNAMKAFLLQAKHRQKKCVTYDDLYQTNSDKDDFSLPMYYLSYQKIKSTFDVQKMILCTNTELRVAKGCSAREIKKGSLGDNDLLYFKDMNHQCYTFDETVVPFLIEKVKEYKENNLKNQSFHENVFDYDQVEEFLSKFQLVTGYPTEGDLDVVIEEMLHGEQHCNKYETKDCAKFVNNKMMEWFEGKQGRYLTRDTLKIFLSEFRSTKFCEKLRNFHMHVDGDSLSYSRTKRLLHIESRRGYVLNMIKAYCALYTTKRKCLFLSPNEYFATQIEMVQAFERSGYDTLVACFKASDAVSTEAMSDKITNVLKKYAWKRVILITGKSDRLAEVLRKKNGDNYEEVYENISFNDLSMESQNRLLMRVIQFFHTSI
ncbi:uncharacterized protein LOC108911976 [Anoplophora glabripennis]|uniref:uncharacterized protein LOC108911976 n=1 Tax=Anoplophora glabripennis TaxID=217634 RepID=UPI000874AFEF|nr:uncharacterized protein LOC108911976 [Anoplophora glabripennis]